MITYDATYGGDAVKPSLTKTFTATSGEEFVVVFGAYTPPEELDYIDEPIITKHMDDLILYIQYIASQMTYVDFGANSFPNGTPIVGTEEINWATMQLNGFWSYMRHDRFASLDEEL